MTTEMTRFDRRHPIDFVKRHQGRGMHEESKDAGTDSGRCDSVDAGSDAGDSGR